MHRADDRSTQVDRVVRSYRGFGTKPLRPYGSLVISAGAGRTPAPFLSKSHWVLIAFRVRFAVPGVRALLNPVMGVLFDSPGCAFLSFDFRP